MDFHPRDDGLHRYLQCRCGARRVQLTGLGLYSDPVRLGWPMPGRLHGRAVNDSGWVRPPAGGWPAYVQEAQ